MKPIYRIHPAIGVARIGDSEAFFDGPEVVDQDYLPPAVAIDGKPDAHYRDASGRIRRQAAVFRIYEYRYLTERAMKKDRPFRVREITLSDGTEITWTVKIANLKSFRGDPNDEKLRRPVDLTQRERNEPDAVTLGGPNHSAMRVVTKMFGEDVVLGEFATDAEGHLRALAGFGAAGPKGTAVHGIESQNWYDDLADGPVAASLVIDGESFDADPAWLVTGPPRFAQPIEPIVSLFDLAYDVAVRKGWIKPPVKASFLRHIYPILHTTMMTSWVNAAARSAGHGFEESDRFALLEKRGLIDRKERRKERERIFDRLRGPVGEGIIPDTSVGDMPKLEFVGLTDFQYKMMHQWAIGEFFSDWPGERPAAPDFDSLRPRKQARALDRAHLGSIVGLSLVPGIEVGLEVRHAIWRAAFRISDHVGAGELTASLGIPWQFDFSECVEGWWPSAHPDSVLPETATSVSDKFQFWSDFSKQDMVDRWKEHGFLARNGELYVETERVAPYPTSPPKSPFPFPVP